MARKRALTLLLLATLCVCLPRLLAASAIADSTLAFSNLSIMAASGSLTLDDVWFLQAFASANNSIGGSDAQFNFAFSPGATSANAAVVWATGNAAASAPGIPPNLNVSGSALSSVNIPGCTAAAAFSQGLSTLSNSFTVSGTGMVAVQFAIDIVGMLHAMTDACGLTARTETIFRLAVDGGDPILFDDRFLSIGASDSQTQAFAEHLSNTFLLAAGVSHFLILQADSESRAQISISEPPSSALLLAGFGTLIWAYRRRSMRREA